MSFADDAEEEAGSIVTMVTGLLAEIIAHKKVVDEGTRDLLTCVQTSLIAVRTTAGDCRTHIQTAARCRQFTEVGAPPPVDGKRLAAHDLEDEPATPEPEPGFQRTRSVEEIEQLLKLES